MAGTPPDGPNHLSSCTASITVLAVKPVKFGGIFALASVEIDLDGMVLVIPWGSRDPRSVNRHTHRFTGVPRENGVWQRAITLPEEISGAIGRVILDELVERGLASRGPVP
jgi:hypothetical protein